VSCNNDCRDSEDGQETAVSGAEKGRIMELTSRADVLAARRTEWEGVASTGSDRRGGLSNKSKMQG